MTFSLWKVYISKCNLLLVEKFLVSDLLLYKTAANNIGLTDTNKQHCDSFMFLFELKNVKFLRSLGTKGEFTSCSSNQ